MKKFLVIGFYLFPLFVFCQNEIIIIGSTGVSSGFTGDFMKSKNKTLVDFNGQEIGKYSSLETNYGANVGCRAQTGIQWKGLRFGFRFGYDRVFFRKHIFKTTPQLFTHNPYTTSIKTEFNIFSYGVFVGYMVTVTKKLNITPEIGIGSFSGFLNDHHAYLNKPNPEENWGFYNFMDRKVEMSVAFRFEIPFNNISLFIAPEYDFLFYRNTVFARTTDKIFSHISSGAIEVGVCGNIHKFLLKGKKSK